MAKPGNTLGETSAPHIKSTNEPSAHEQLPPRTPCTMYSAFLFITLLGHTQPARASEDHNPTVHPSGAGLQLVAVVDKMSLCTQGSSNTKLSRTTEDCTRQCLANSRDLANVSSSAYSPSLVLLILGEPDQVEQ